MELIFGEEVGPAQGSNVIWPILNFHLGAKIGAKRWFFDFKTFRFSGLNSGSKVLHRFGLPNWALRKIVARPMSHRSRPAPGVEGYLCLVHVEVVFGTFCAEVL